MDAKRWIKSSHSARNGNCVEVAHDTAWTAIRDSKRPSAAVLVVPQQAFARCLGRVAAAGANDLQLT